MFNAFSLFFGENKMTNSIKIIYLRVSKQDLKEKKTELQVLEDQLPPILKKFNLKESECLILKEKGSAYKIDQIWKRKEFLKILDMCFMANTVTIIDLFLGNYIKDSNLELYVFDSNRIMRNIEFGTMFNILRSLFGIKLFSVNQSNLNISPNETMGVKMSKYLMSTVDSYLAEGYSKNISDHTRKAVKIQNGVTMSNKGNIWGNKFTDLAGNKVSLTPSRYVVIRQFIHDCVKQNPNLSNSYLKAQIAASFNLNISYGFINNRRRELKNG